nr:zinc finger, CCHC-type [Tanacetum cinerariifolium]
MEKELVEAVETEDFERAEARSGLVMVKMQEALEMHIVADEECAGFPERFAGIGKKDAIEKDRTRLENKFPMRGLHQYGLINGVRYNTCSGFSLYDSVSDLISNGGWRWSNDWYTRYLELAQMTTTIVNNSLFRSLFEKQKLTGNNFMEWYRNLRIVLSTEDKLPFLEQPIPVLPVPPEGKTNPPDVKNQKKKPHKATKGNQGKDKEKMGNALVPAPSYAPKPKNPPTPKKDNPVYDTGCDTRICITTQGLRRSRKLKPRALSLYLGDGHRARVEAIGEFHLCLPSGLVLILHSCHYAPSITRGIISVSRLYKDDFVNRFENDNSIFVSKINLIHFNAIPRDDIYEIVMLKKDQEKEKIGSKLNKKGSVKENSRKGQNRIKTRQKQEAWRSREKLKAVTVERGRKTEENKKRMAENANTCKKLFKFKRKKKREAVGHFYNALNPVDQDSLNAAAGGNLLEKSPQDALTIIENKSKQTNAVTTAMTAMLKQFQSNPPPAQVKAVEEICVTCGGAHPYYQCLVAGGNTFPEYRDNIQDTMTDNRTMAEMLCAPTEGCAEAILVPPILDEQFELKHSLINMMTSEQFFGLEKDNPHDHVR